MMRLLWLSAFVCAADQVTKLLALAYLKEGGVSVSPFLFLPFFTTKTRGTGLGLAYSRKVMEALGAA